MNTCLRCNHDRFESRGWTLPELLVTVAIGALVMMAIAGFTVYSLRSFVAMANYADLDEKSRRTVDEMTRQIRQASGIANYNNTGAKRWITLTNSVVSDFVRYTWVSQDRVLYFERKGTPMVTNLTECDSWDFTLYQRTPIPGTTNKFHPATNGAGNIDISKAKMVDMRWRCSREILSKAFQTESVQTTKIVLRNHD